jgi:demethylmenaquinone methyltransferase/2-methoxy-6-polyprenyl-1,4-benzoquinol methylase
MTIRSMFAGVVKTYDLINHMLTLGLDTIWRKRCAIECAMGGIILDLCCGTGDLTLAISVLSTPGTQIVSLDFNRGMLQQAKKKKIQKEAREGTSLPITFVHADAAHLPFKAGCFNRIGISFSFRNLIYKNPLAMVFLKEILRTLSPTGKFVCVETSQPKSRFLKHLYHLYNRTVVSFIGGLVSGRKAAYNYLGSSATNFPDGGKVRELLLRAGFQQASYQSLTFGMVGLFRGKK